MDANNPAEPKKKGLWIVLLKVQFKARGLVLSQHIHYKYYSYTNDLQCQSYRLWHTKPNDKTEAKVFINMFCRNKEVSWYLCGWVFSHSAVDTTTRAHTFSFLSRCRLTIINCRVWSPQGAHAHRQAHTHWFCKFNFHNTLWLLTCRVHVHTISRTHTDFDTPNTFFTHDGTSSTESAICCVPVNWLCGYHCDGLTGKWKKLMQTLTPSNI